MAIPVTGAISMNSIQTEFGGTNPISLNEYYRGGNIVLNLTDVIVNNSIPTTGAISMNSFRGTAAFYGLQDLVNQGGLSGFEIVDQGQDAFAYFTIGTAPLSTEYTMVKSEGIGIASQITGGEWVRTASNTPGEYEIRVNVTSGTLSFGGPQNTWLRLNTGLNFGVTRAIFQGPGTSTATVNIQFRFFSTGTIVYTSPSLTFSAALL